MDTVPERLLSWAKEHKIAAVLLAIGIVFIGFVLLSLSTIILGGGEIGSMQSASMDRGMSDAAGGPSLHDLKAQTQTRADYNDRGDGGGEAFVEVQEARFDIDAADADADAEWVRSLAETHNGYVEESRKHETSLHRTIDMTVRVPDDRFDTVIETLKAEYDVDSYNVRNHRVSTQREIDELAILNRTLADYERIRGRINEMHTDEEQINLLMTLTDRELDIKEKQKRYERQLSDKQQRGDEATIRVELRERKSVDIWPENLKNRFMSNIKGMLNSVTDIVLSTATQAVVLFFKAVQAVIYLVVIMLPFLLAYRIGRRVYEEYWR